MLLLMSQHRRGLVEVAAVVARQHAEQGERRGREPGVVGSAAAEAGVTAGARQHLGRAILAVDAQGAHPGEMVQPHVVELDALDRDAEHGREVDAHVPGDVAQADHPQRRVPPQQLGDQSGRVGEVDERGAGASRSTTAAISSMTGNGAERLGKAPDPRGLLPDEAELAPEQLVAMTGGLPADAQLTDDEVRPPDRIGGVAGRAHRHARARGLGHAPREPSDDLEPQGVGVEQHELGHGKCRRAAQQAVDQLGRVGRPAADHADLHPLTPVTVTPSTNTRCARKKRIVVGSMKSRVAAIVRFHCVCLTERNSERPSDSV